MKGVADAADQTLGTWSRHQVAQWMFVENVEITNGTDRVLPAKFGMQQMTFEGMTVKDVQRHIDALKVRLKHAKTDMEAIRARRQIREAETAILRSSSANLREK